MNSPKYILTIHNNQGSSWTYKVHSISEAKRLMSHEFTDPRNLSAAVVDISGVNSITALQRTNTYNKQGKLI